MNSNQSGVEVSDRGDVGGGMLVVVRHVQNPRL